MIKACPELTEMGSVWKIPMGAPAGAAGSPVLLSYAKACPVPSAFVVKMPGDAGTTFTLCGADAPLLRLTTMSTVPVGTVNGSCALICPELTKYNPAGIPLKVTDVTSLNAVGSGMVFPEDVEAAKFVPKMDTREPGATPCAVYLPEFTTPPAPTAGNSSVSEVSKRMRPFPVSAM